MKTSVTLKFRPSRADGQDGSLFIQFIKDRRSATVTTPYKVFCGEWDARRGCIVIPTSDRQRAQRLGMIATQLDADIARLREAIAQMDDIGGSYTLYDAAALYRNRDAAGRLGPFVESLREKLLRAGQYRTARSYLSVANKLREFNGGQDVPIASIDEAMVTGFDRWMKHMGNAGNTRSFYLRGLRTILGKAVRAGALDRMPESLFSGVKTGICKTGKRALKPEVLHALASLDLTAARENHQKENGPAERPPLTLSGLKRDRRAGLAFSRDLFMLSFYMMGISFIDLAFLKKSDMKDGIISYRRSKTGQAIFVALTPEIAAILHRYARLAEGTEYLLPIITQGDKPARLQYESALRTHNNRLRRLCGVLKSGNVKTSVFTSYAARHSWASIARDTGARVSMISQGLGHDSERTTAIYLDSVDFAAMRALNKKVIKAVLAA